MQVGLKLNPLYPSDEKSSTFEGKSYGRAMEEGMDLSPEAF